jgi:hypothetical protein
MFELKVDFKCRFILDYAASSRSVTRMQEKQKKQMNDDNRLHVVQQPQCRSTSFDSLFLTLEPLVFSSDATPVG